MNDAQLVLTLVGIGIGFVRRFLHVLNYYERKVLGEKEETEGYHPKCKINSSWWIKRILEQYVTKYCFIDSSKEQRSEALRSVQSSCW